MKQHEYKVGGKHGKHDDFKRWDRETLEQHDPNVIESGTLNGQ